MVRLFVFARDSRILFLRKINRTHRQFFRTNVIDFPIKKIHRAKTMLILISNDYDTFYYNYFP